MQPKFFSFVFLNSSLHRVDIPIDQTQPILKNSFRMDWTERLTPATQQVNNNNKL